ncbi:MAG: substrate-binding domain-containing protein [Nitrospirae bacterium]|nr:substrate-binding domain-containing protein [Nitrospirota bacterium]
MSKYKTFFIAGLVLFLMSGAIALGAEIKVNGGGAAINTVFRPLASPYEKATGNTLNVLQSTPKNGLIDLIEGKADIATAAVTLENMIKGAEKDGITVDPASLQQTEIAKNRTVVFLHKDNPVKKLSREELKGIFTGKITNWAGLGGNDLPIIVIWGKASPGQNAVFTQEILDGEAVTKDVLDATDYVNIKETVAANAEAIGIDPLGLSDATVSVPNIPEISRPIIAVTKGRPSPDVQKLFDFIKGEGRGYIKQ